MSEVSQAQKTKNHMFSLMRTLDLGQIQQCGWTESHDKGRAHTGGMGIDKKPKT
jgi:hypothetical protein